MTKIAEIKPCPFCSGAKVYVRTIMQEADIFCPECETNGPVHDSEAEAVAAWNTRTADPAVQALVEALRPFADIFVGQNPDWQPLVRLDRDAILAVRAALAAFDKTD